MQTLKSNDPDIAKGYSSIGHVYRKKQELNRSFEMLEKALAIWQKALGDDTTEVAKCYSDIGNV